MPDSLKCDMCGNFHVSDMDDLQCLNDELTRLREELEDLQESAKRAAGEMCGDEKHCSCVPLLRRELAAAQERAEIAEAAVSVYRDFLNTELHWEWFRADQLGQSSSEQNAQKLRDWLEANEDPGKNVCDRIAELEKDKARYIKAFQHIHVASYDTENRNDVCRECGLNLRDQIHERVAIDAAGGE